MCILYVFSMLGWFELILVVQYLIAVRHRPQADLPLYAARRCCVRREDIYIYIGNRIDPRITRKPLQNAQIQHIRQQIFLRTQIIFNPPPKNSTDLQKP